MPRPDPGDIGFAAAIWTFGMLMLPKREWRSIPARLREAARGDRPYLFGSPARTGALSDDVIERWIQLVLREFWRMVELGVPLFVLAKLAEVRGARRLEEASTTPTLERLLSDHLRGRLGVSGLHARLQAQGQLLPAPKLVYTPPPPPRPAPPIEWAIEWQEKLRALAGEKTAGNGSKASPAPAKPEGELEPLVIETLGTVRLLSGDQDLAPDLLHKPKQSFFWFYLLLRIVRRPGERLTRMVFGDETFPLLDAKRQRTAIRHRITDVLTELPPVLRRRVRTTRECIWIELDDQCFLDVRWVLDLARDVRSRKEPVPDALLEEIERAIEPASEEFVPIWEEIEREGIEGEGNAATIVGEIRDMVEAAHMSLAVSLAGGHLARQHPERAIPHLEKALHRRPERYDVAKLLVAAYERAGQRQAADRIRETYA